ncbi:hypothetical protein K3495_g1325 [Podosphaera aphanis]|nr:hypothetical protein K3495_g1325 [Podosphaera aphanis]
MSEQGHWAREGGFERGYRKPSESSRNNDLYNSPFSPSNTPARNALDNMPVFDVVPFSGNGQDGARWIFKLRRAFKAAGIVGKTPPEMWIGAIWSGVEGRAIQWMDSAPHLRHIIELLRRSPSQLTAEMAERFTEEFEETFRMVEQSETPRSPMEMLDELKQGPRGSLANYLAKSKGILHQLGVNRSNQEDPRTATMRSCLIGMVTSKFLAGLYDGVLRRRSIERGAASAKTLEECSLIIWNVESSIIDERKQLLLQRESWKSQGFDEIMKSPNRVNEVLGDFARRYHYQPEVERMTPRHPEVYQGPCQNFIDQNTWRLEQSVMKCET